MEHCKNCRFWIRNNIENITYEVSDWRDESNKYTQTEYQYSPSEYEWPRHKLLKVEKINSKFGKCSNPNIIYTCSGGCIEDDDLKYKDHPDALLYSDGEAYGAYFMTGEDFGCVHFQQENL